MAKPVSHRMTYDATLPEVAAMLADADFRRAVCDRLGVLRSEVAIEPRGEGMAVRIEQAQRADGIPSFARKLVGDEIQIVQSEAWDTAHCGDITVTIPGKPGEMSGTAVLAGNGRTTIETVDLTVRVGIPLVGGRLEGLIADLLLRALRTEEEVGREWLAGR